MLKRLLYNKLVMLLLLSVGFVVVGGYTDSVSLANRAIVLGMAWDIEPNGDLSVACQVLTATSASNDIAGANSYNVVKGSGETLELAFKNIELTIAGYLSFAHCNVILVGEELLRSRGIFKELDYMIKNSKLTENTGLMCAEGRASDILALETAPSGISSFGIQQQMIVNKAYSRVYPSTVLDYIVSVYDVKPNINIIYLTVSGEVEEGSGGGDSPRPKYSFDLERIANCDRDKLRRVMTDDEAMYYCLVKKKFEEGVYTLLYEGEYYDFFFKSNDCSISVSLYDVPTVTIEIRSVLYYNNKILEIFESVDNPLEEVLSDSISEGVESLYTSFYLDGIDVYSIYMEFYKSYGTQFTDRYDSETALMEHLELRVDSRREAPLDRLCSVSRCP